MIAVQPPSSSPLVAPILLALVAGIVEFSHAYNLQISVTQAAREAAREMAIEDDQGRSSTGRGCRRAGAQHWRLRIRLFSPGCLQPQTKT
jgi:hypothetical protein